MKKQKMFLILMLVGILGTLGLFVKKAFAQTFPLPAPNSGPTASSDNVYFVTADEPAGAVTCWDSGGPTEYYHVVGGFGAMPRCDARDRDVPASPDPRGGGTISRIYSICLISGSPDRFCRYVRDIPSGITTTPCTLVSSELVFAPVLS